MGSISGLMLAGMIIGIALMAGFQLMMQRRSTKRTAKAADIKVLASLTVEELKKLIGDRFPRWMSFPFFDHQVKWLNELLSLCWPSVAHVENPSIREYVERLLEACRDPGIASLKFKTLILGTIAPKIKGVRVQTQEKSRIIMDIELGWSGDSDITLVIETARHASVPLQLKDIQFEGVIRVIFQLSEDTPWCISAVAVAILSDPIPQIDYTLKALGRSGSVSPSIFEMIEDTVTSVVKGKLEWPQRIIVPLSTGVDTSHLELRPQGKLTVTVVKANDLKNKQMIGKSDPCAVLHIRPLYKWKTKVIEDNLNPVWNETFELTVEDKETQSLTIEVFDEGIREDLKLGVTKLRLTDLVPDSLQEVNLRLTPALDMSFRMDKKDRGTITVKVVYHPFNKEEQNAAMKEMPAFL